MKSPMLTENHAKNRIIVAISLLIKTSNGESNSVTIFFRQTLNSTKALRLNDLSALKAM